MDDAPRALVTGSSGSIGAALVRSLLDAGWHVTGLDRAPPPAGLDAKRFRALDADLADAAATARACDELRLEGRPLQALVHVAGVSERTPAGSGEVARFERILRVNLTSAFVLADGLLPLLREGAPACLVFVSSVHARHTVPGMGAYAASKGGLEAMARALSAELAPHGIGVVCVAPGAVDTPMLREGAKDRGAAVPEAFVSKPEDVARVLALLLDPAFARPLSGSVLTLDRGATAWLPTEFKP